MLYAFYNTTNWIKLKTSKITTYLWNKISIVFQYLLKSIKNNFTIKSLTKKLILILLFGLFSCILYSWIYCFKNNVFFEYILYTLIALLTSLLSVYLYASFQGKTEKYVDFIVSFLTIISLRLILIIVFGYLHQVYPDSEVIELLNNIFTINIFRIIVVEIIQHLDITIFFDKFLENSYAIYIDEPLNKLNKVSIEELNKITEKISLGNCWDRDWFFILFNKAIPKEDSALIQIDIATKQEDSALIQIHIATKQEALNIKNKNNITKVIFPYKISMKMIPVQRTIPIQNNNILSTKIGILDKTKGAFSPILSKINKDVFNIGGDNIDNWKAKYISDCIDLNSDSSSDSNSIDDSVFSLNSNTESESNFSENNSESNLSNNLSMLENYNKSEVQDWKVQNYLKSLNNSEPPVLSDPYNNKIDFPSKMEKYTMKEDSFNTKGNLLSKNNTKGNLLSKNGHPHGQIIDTLISWHNNVIVYPIFTLDPAEAQQPTPIFRRLYYNGSNERYVIPRLTNHYNANNWFVEGRPTFNLPITLRSDWYNNIINNMRLSFPYLDYNEFLNRVQNNSNFFYSDRNIINNNLILINGRWRYIQNNGNIHDFDPRYNNWVEFLSTPLANLINNLFSIDAFRNIFLIDLYYVRTAIDVAEWEKIMREYLRFINIRWISVLRDINIQFIAWRQSISQYNPPTIGPLIELFEQRLLESAELRGSYMTTAYTEVLNARNRLTHLIAFPEQENILSLWIDTRVLFNESSEPVRIGTIIDVPANQQQPMLRIRHRNNVAPLHFYSQYPLLIISVLGNQGYLNHIESPEIFQIDNIPCIHLNLNYYLELYNAWYRNNRF